MQIFPLCPTNVDRIAGCFMALGYKRACLEIARDPTVNDLRAAVSRLFADAQPNDKIVFYYTGHGETTKGGRFYLLTTDSELNRLSGTALAADDLMHMVLDSKLNHVLLILDTCYSGRGGPGAKPVRATSFHGKGLRHALARSLLF
jgi:uncharacterized caspase-like protein